jgi:hypothetical protein
MMYDHATGTESCCDTCKTLMMHFTLLSFFLGMLRWPRCLDVFVRIQDTILEVRRSAV